MKMQPLVSIAIPAYNAEEWIGHTLESAVGQTWPRKEIIVVNDGSTDGTAEIAKRFASKQLKVVSTENRGLSAAVNHALRQCQGDYIQELDSDDLLAPNKIEVQLAALRETDSKRILLSSPWAHFYFRPHRAHFVPNALWRDLSPVEWLLTKMGQNLHMQNATWLASRELVEAAGPWEETLQYDQDGEYFCRMLVASEGTRFVPEGRVFYRSSRSDRISYIGRSTEKQNSMLRSIKLHVQYLRGLEESERVRTACLAYLRNWFPAFYPHRPDAIVELRSLAADLQGHLEEPRLPWKYAWMEPIVGTKVAAMAQQLLPEKKATMIRNWDKVMSSLETFQTSRRNAANLASPTQKG